jgi:hypothetical protein
MGKKKAPRFRGALQTTHVAHPTHLAFGELEALAGTGTTGLLTLLGAAITGEKAIRLQSSTVFRVHANQCASNAETDRTDLTRDTATSGRDSEIISHAAVRQREREKNLILVGDDRKVVLEVAAVDSDATAAFANENAGNGGFTAAGGSGDGLAHEMLRKRDQATEKGFGF